MTIRYVYLRPTRDCTPVGCAAYSIDYDNGTLTYQVSAVNDTEVVVDGKKSRDHFDRKMARTLADEKFAVAPITIKAEEIFAVWETRLDNLIEEKGKVRASNKRDMIKSLFALRAAELDMIENSGVASVMAAISLDSSIPSRCSKAAKQWLRNLAELNASYIEPDMGEVSEECGSDCGGCECH